MKKEGVLLELDKKQLKELGEYQKGYAYISKDFSYTVLFFKPIIKSKHHVYYVPNYDVLPAEVLCFAIFALLHEEGKNRSKVVIKQERTGIDEFYFSETVQEIYIKICQFRAINLKIMY